MNLFFWRLARGCRSCETSAVSPTPARFSELCSPIEVAQRTGQAVPGVSKGRCGRRTEKNAKITAPGVRERVAVALKMADEGTKSILLGAVKKVDKVEETEQDLLCEHQKIQKWSQRPQGWETWSMKIERSKLDTE